MSNNVFDIQQKLKEHDERMLHMEIKHYLSMNDKYNRARYSGKLTYERIALSDSIKDIIEGSKQQIIQYANRIRTYK